MSDFSFFSLFTAGLACLVPLTNAYTQPVGASPKGNPIWTPGLNDVVPVGKPYTITVSKLLRIIPSGASETCAHYTRRH